MKKTLISAALMFVFSLTMLLGTTYAWWHEEIVIQNNELRMGNLNIQAEIADPNIAESDRVWYDLETVPSRSIFERVNLEPGSHDARLVRITNTGSIPLAYRVVLEAPTVNPNFNQFVNFYAELYGTNNHICPQPYRAVNIEKYLLLAPGDSHTFLVKFHIDTRLGETEGTFGEFETMKFAAPNPKR